MASPLVLGPITGAIGTDRARIGFRARSDAPFSLRVLHQGREEPFLRTQVNHYGAVVVIDVLGLRPGTTYTYALYPDPQMQGPALAQGTFRTAPPALARVPFTFGLAGTFLPRHPASEGIVRRMAEVLGREDAAFLLLMGNQICADAPPWNGLDRPPRTLEEYRRLYEMAWGQPAWQAVFRQHAVFPVLGHREVDWGWFWDDGERTTARLPWGVRWWRRLRGWPTFAWDIDRHRVVVALQAFWEHQGFLAPSLPTPPEGISDLGRPLLLPTDPGHFGYAFVYAAAAFYVLDLYTHRVKGSLGRYILHPRQWKALEAWLASVSQGYPVVFLVSPASLFFQGPGDSWAFDPDGLRRLLHMVVARGLRSLVVLSHGLEIGRVVEADVENRGRRARIWEIGVGAMTPGVRPFWTRRVMRVPSPLIRHLRVHAWLPEPQFGWVRVEWEPNVRVHWGFAGQATTLQGEIGPLA